MLSGFGSTNTACAPAAYAPSYAYGYPPTNNYNGYGYNGYNGYGYNGYNTMQPIVNNCYITRNIIRVVRVHRVPVIPPVVTPPVPIARVAPVLPIGNRVVPVPRVARTARPFSPSITASRRPVIASHVSPVMSVRHVALRSLPCDTVLMR